MLRRLTGAVLAACALTLALPAAAQSTDTNTYDQLVAKADKLLAERDFYQAEAIYKQARELAPKRPEALRGLGRIYRWQKRDLDARRLLEEAVAGAPEDGLAHFFLGKLLATFRSDAAATAKAIEHLKKAAGLLPPETSINKVNLRVSAYVEIGDLERRRGDVAAARAAYQRALQPTPTERVTRRLGDLAARSGRLSEARDWYEKLVKMAPSNETYAGLLAGVKSRQEVSRVALEVLKPELEVGATLSADHVLFRGYDDKRRIVDFDRYWEVSAGLKLIKTDPLTIKAGDKPSAEEYIYLTDKATGMFAKARVRVLGPTTKLQVEPERLSRSPGTPAVIHLRGVDAAANQFAVTGATWEVQHGGKPVEGFSVKTVGGDSWRVEIPKDAALGSYALIATRDGERVVAQLDVVDYARPPTGPSWLTSLDEARAAAAKANKPLMVYLWTVDCATCDKLAYDVFTDKVVSSDLDLFVRVRVNAANVPDMLRLYRIRAIPSMIFLSPDGVYLARISDYMSAESLHRRLIAAPDLAAKAEKELGELRAKAGDKANAAAHKALGDFYKKSYMNAQAAASYRKALAASPPAQMGHAIRLGLAQLASFERDFAEMERLVDEVLKGETPAETRWDAQAMYYKAFCLFYGRAQMKQAEAMWRALVKKHPRNSWARRARERLRELF